MKLNGNKASFLASLAQLNRKKKGSLSRDNDVPYQYLLHLLTHSLVLTFVSFSDSTKVHLTFFLSFVIINLQAIIKQ